MLLFFVVNRTWHLGDMKRKIAILLLFFYCYSSHQGQGKQSVSRSFSICRPNKKYTSPDIQNKLIDLCADQIINSLVADCNAAQFFGFISDESTDCSTKEQASICVRFYDKNAKAVREEFLGFTEAKRTTGEALADLFLS